MNRDQVVAILESGVFDGLIGEGEHQELEVKRSPEAVLSCGARRRAGSTADCDDALLAQLRAYAYTEGGRQLGDRSTSARGRDLWEGLAGRTADGGYNLANAEQMLFELAVGELGHLGALENEHEHLAARARRGYEAVVADGAVPDDLKLQALTNLGNSYDLMGRDLDGVAAWERRRAELHREGSVPLDIFT